MSQTPSSSPEALLFKALMAVIQRLQAQILVFVVGYVILLIGVARYGQPLVIELKALFYVLPLVAMGGYILIEYHSIRAQEERRKQMAEPSKNRTALQRQLNVAQRVLDALEERAAGYTTLTMPAELKVQLEEQRQKVADLETKLAESSDEEESCG
jgi:hypothetical protein